MKYPKRIYVCRIRNERNLHAIHDKFGCIYYVKSNNRYMQSWVYAESAKKISLKCEEHEVHLVLHDSGYYSQRCCNCGLVLKSNRKGRLYTCKGCGNQLDADLNSSLNHEKKLPEVPFEFKVNKKNIKGYYWLENGIFNLLEGENGKFCVSNLSWSPPY